MLWGGLKIENLGVTKEMKSVAMVILNKISLEEKEFNIFLVFESL